MNLKKSKKYFERANDLISCQIQPLNKDYTLVVLGVSPIFLKKDKAIKKALKAMLKSIWKALLLNRFLERFDFR